LARHYRKPERRAERTYCGDAALCTLPNSAAGIAETPRRGSHAPLSSALAVATSSGTRERHIRESKHHGERSCSAASSCDREVGPYLKELITEVGHGFGTRTQVGSWVRSHTARSAQTVFPPSWWS